MNKNAIEAALARLRGNVGNQLKNTQTREKTADRRRSQSKSVLDLNRVLGLGKKTAIEEALAEINAEQGAFSQQLTHDLIKTFAKRAKELQKTHGLGGGITPREIINRSRRIDIQRAQNEIVTVVAARQEKNGVIRFRTNASPQSKDNHHIVSVQFLNFPAALNTIGNSRELAKSVLRGAVKFDCDCGRHRFWYRYIATSGGFNLGKAETAYPKIRNPELTGLGCKHVLRVMHTLQSTIQFVPIMKQMIERYRKDPNAAAKVIGKKQAEQQARETAKAAGKTIRRRFANADKIKRDLQTAAKQAKSGSLAKYQNLLKKGMIDKREYEILIKAL